MIFCGSFDYGFQMNSLYLIYSYVPGTDPVPSPGVRLPSSVIVYPLVREGNAWILPENYYSKRLSILEGKLVQILKKGVYYHRKPPRREKDLVKFKDWFPAIGETNKGVRIFAVGANVLHSINEPYARRYLGLEK